MRSSQQVLVTITIDSECDHAPNWARSAPLSFRSICHGIPERLQPLFDTVGAAPTYLLTIEVLEDPQSVAALRALHGRFELGTHLHSAFIEPEKKYQDYSGVSSTDFQCHCAPQVEYEKLRNLTRSFEEQFDRKPTSFRAGRFGAGAYTIDALERLGYKVDTSVTPHERWRHVDGDVDYHNAPSQPYFPVRGSLIGDDGASRHSILEIPVTIETTWLGKRRWLRPWISSRKQMRWVVGQHLQRHSNKHVVVLNVMFHSMEVIPRASPYPQNELQVSAYLDDLREFLAWSSRKGFTFVTASECYEYFK